MDLGSVSSVVRGDTTVGLTNAAQGSCAPTASLDKIYVWTAPAVGRVNISVCPFSNWCAAVAYVEGRGGQRRAGGWG